MNTFTFNSAVVSDLHKDAYGFRPSADFWQEWNNTSDSNRQCIWDRLLQTLEISLEQERESQQLAIQRFENQVTEMLPQYHDRAAVIQAMMEKHHSGNDYEYFCFTQGLPYGYFNSEPA